MISELRADLTNLVGEPRLEKISFFLGIPKFGCQLFVKREIIYDGHEASIGEADLLLAFCCLHLDENVVPLCLHLDENVVPLLVVFLSFFCVVYVVLFGGSGRQQGMWASSTPETMISRVLV